MDWQIGGIPLHPLIVHATVVLVPLAAILVIATAAWPWLARRLGILTPLLALVALATVPLATEAGEWLEERSQESELLERHTELGDGFIVYAALLAAAAVVLWAWQHVVVRGGRLGRTTRIAGSVGIGILAAVAAALAIWQVVLVGHSGAESVWLG